MTAQHPVWIAQRLVGQPKSPPSLEGPSARGLTAGLSHFRFWLFWNFTLGQSESWHGRRGSTQILRTRRTATSRCSGIEGALLSRFLSGAPFIEWARGACLLCRLGGELRSVPLPAPQVGLGGAGVIANHKKSTNAKRK